ncbi:MAG: N-glycosylase/DNA lyase [Candidatus ainarchaeum sp.]|nr:N-glycosylase/DNA lyase [Candidatus ainarchaeum sp.]
MSSLVSQINYLKKKDVKQVIDKKIKSFSKIKNKSNKEIFKELSFCVLTANYNAKKAIEIQKKIKDGFLFLSLKDLSLKLKELGYRYPNLRAEYIVSNRKHLDSLKTVLKTFKDKQALRDWFAENIKGISYKESSHFLRNIGYNDYAIIDFHIVDILIKNGYLKEKPKSLNRQKYLEIENILAEISKKVKLSQGELDFYLWYLETGTVLK